MVTNVNEMELLLSVLVGVLISKVTCESNSTIDFSLGNFGQHHDSSSCLELMCTARLIPIVDSGDPRSVASNCSAGDYKLLLDSVIAASKTCEGPGHEFLRHFLEPKRLEKQLRMLCDHTKVFEHAARCLITYATDMKNCHKLRMEFLAPAIQNYRVTKQEAGVRSAVCLALYTEGYCIYDRLSLCRNRKVADIIRQMVLGPLAGICTDSEVTFDNSPSKGNNNGRRKNGRKRGKKRKKPPPVSKEKPENSVVNKETRVENVDKKEGEYATKSASGYSSMSLYLISMCLSLNFIVVYNEKYQRFLLN